MPFAPGESVRSPTCPTRCSGRQVTGRPLENVTVLGQFKPSRDLDLLPALATELRAQGFRPVIKGSGWPQIPGWDVDARFLYKGRVRRGTTVQCLCPAPLQASVPVRCCRARGGDVGSGRRSTCEQPPLVVRRAVARTHRSGRRRRQMGEAGRGRDARLPDPSSAPFSPPTMTPCAVGAPG